VFFFLNHVGSSEIHDVTMTARYEPCRVKQIIYDEAMTVEYYYLVAQLCTYGCHRSASCLLDVHLEQLRI
jgi:hypothetical protein